MKFEFSIWDIAKSITLIVVVVFLYTQWQNILDKIESKPTPPPQIIHFTDNAMVLAFKANTERLEDLEEQLKKSNSIILAEVKKQGERIDEIGVVKGKIKQTVDLKNRKSDKSYKNEKKPKLNYEFKKVYGSDTDGKKFLSGWTMFYPNQDPSLYWKTGTYPLDFNLNIIETQLDDGTYKRYAEFYASNEQMGETKGEKFPLDVEMKWEKRELKDKKFSFNPRLGFGMEATSNVVTPVLDLSLFSYGKTNVDMDWRFLEGSVGYDGDYFNVGLVPFSWNFGKSVPLIQNMFLGPAAVYDDEDKEFSYGVSFSIPF